MVMKLKALMVLFLFAFFITPTYAAKPTPPPTISNLVCLDPGHGGTDSGARNQDLTEKAVNLDVALLLESKLLKAGFTVAMTRRDNDTTLTNADRYNFCNSNKAAILVSIHHNGATATNVDYTTALYMKKTDLRLANVVAETVSSQLGLTNNQTSRFASGVLLKAKMPATISEGFFLTNSAEYDAIKTGNRLDQEAGALLLAIQTYLAN